MKIPKILVTPLNWGLGHATRCIPIIKSLEENGAEVFIASDGVALDLLKKEFPKNIVFEIPSYDIHYKGNNFGWTMLRQSSKILAAIAKEYKAVKKIVEEHQIDAIISDNRFGCYYKGIPSVFMTHQLNMIAPTKILEKPANKVNHILIDNFQKVWVPDLQGDNSLAGRLSQEHDLDVTYLGVLSRMKNFKVEKKYDVAVVLSGPEPKRSEFELEIFRQALQLDDKRFIVVRGQPERWEYYFMKPHLEVVSFMTSQMLNETMLSADMIIARSGYSTVMDLWKLQKPALLVPTPGQTEQEYLAEELSKKNLFLTQSQEDLNIEKALTEINSYQGFLNENILEPFGKIRTTSDLDQSIKDFLKTLEQT